MDTPLTYKIAITTTMTTTTIVIITTITTITAAIIIIIIIIAIKNIFKSILKSIIIKKVRSIGLDRHCSTPDLVSEGWVGFAPAWGSGTSTSKSSALPSSRWGFHLSTEISKQFIQIRVDV